MRRDRFWHDLVHACADAFVWRKTILDPPPWPHRFRLFLPIRKARR